MSENEDFSVIAQALIERRLTKEGLLSKVKQNFSLIPLLLEGVAHPKAAVRYGCSKVLMDLSEEHPEKLYQQFDFFVNLLDNKYRILTWNALAIIANLTRADPDNKFDAIFGKYYSFLGNEYMVTVANVVGNSGKIALAKPYLIPEITCQLLKVQTLSTTPHLTDECKRVIAQQAITTFDQFFDKIDQKKQVLSFVQLHANSPRKKLKTVAEKFLKKWG
ncbi:MAG: hypothetical protein CW716_05040 [Candidatus Bathyarchaeum sp.]|nr:MAG: hypothetical protein CW716_05040 [Candidatus Bathyarchaeum sp.]